MKKIFLSLLGILCVSNSWAYTDIGKGEPLILVHAFPTDQQLWKAQRDGLKEHFRVITLDLRGFGNSEKTDGNAITMSEYADEVKQLMDTLHIKKAIVGGESMGGYVALAFLEKYPHLVSGLVLSNTQSIADSQEAKAKREASALDILENGATKFIQNFMSNALSSNVSEETNTFLFNILNRQVPTGMASGLRGMALRSDTSDVLKQTELPILIITGEQDKLISPKQSQHMHSISKNSKLVVIPNAGHLSNLEQPEEWNKAVIECFKPVYP